MKSSIVARSAGKAVMLFLLVCAAAGSDFLSTGAGMHEPRTAHSRHYANRDGSFTAEYVLAPNPAAGETTYVASQDGYWQTAAERWFGTDRTLRVGWFSTLTTFQTWLLFPLDLPVGAVVSRALLRLYATDIYGDDGFDIVVNRYTDGAWTETSPPNRTGSVAREGEITFARPGRAGAFECEPTAIVRDWVTNGADNFGFRLSYANAGTGNYLLVAAREHEVEDYRPRLIVTYTPPAVAEPDPAVRLPVFSLQPNPVTGGVTTLRVTLPPDHPVPGSSSLAPRLAVRVYDAAGREVLSRSLVIRGRTADIPLDLREVSTGVHLVRIEAGGRVATRKLVVSR